MERPGEKCTDTKIRDLENQNLLLRKLVRVNMAMTIAVSAFFAFSAFGDKDAATPRTLIVEGLKILGENGKVIYSIGKGAETSALQRFFDSNGTERVRIGIEADETARVRLFDYKGAPLISNSTFSKKNAKEGLGGQALYKGADQSFYDEEGGKLQLRIRTTVDAQGFAFQDFYDKNGVRRLQLNTSPAGQASHLLFNKAGETSAILYTAANDSVGQIFYDTNKSARIVTEVDANKRAVQKFADPHSTDRILIGTGPLNNNSEGEAFQMINDAAGNIRIMSATMAGTSLQMNADGSGNPKMASAIAADGSFQNHIEKGAGEALWEGIGNILQAWSIIDKISSDE